MPYPKSVIIDDEAIQEVEDVTISVSASVDSETGLWDGKTRPATVTLKRRARNSPTSHFFWYTADAEETSFFKGTIVLQDVAEKPTYTIQMNQCLINNYTFEQPESDGDLVETIEITVWDLELSADGKGKKTFKINPSGESEKGSS